MFLLSCVLISVMMMFSKCQLDTMIFELCSLSVTRSFSTKLPLVKCHDCRGICTLSPPTQPWQCDSQKTRGATRLQWCTCHATWKWTAPTRRTATHLLTTLHKVLAPATQNDFRHATERMSRSATLATGNEACHLSKVTPFADLLP